MGREMLVPEQTKIELISERELRNAGNISRLSFILWGID